VSRPTYNKRTSVSNNGRNYCGFGCYVGGQFLGCIMYAHDLILLSPSLNGLQSMFNLCDAKTHFYI